MRTALLVVLLAAVGAGLLGWSLVVVSPQPSAAGASGGEPAGADAGQLAGLRRAVDQLAARVERLELAASTPTLAPAASQRVPAAGVSAEEFQELRELVSGLRDPGQAAPPRFEELVLGVIEARESREREEREQARLDAAAERLERRVAELAEELGLSSFQSGELLSVLTGEQVERDKIFAELREGGGFDRDAIRDGMLALRASTLTALEGLLSADQYERYVQLSAGDYFFGGGPRGGPDGGASPGRGGGPPGR